MERLGTINKSGCAIVPKSKWSSINETKSTLIKEHGLSVRLHMAKNSLVYGSAWKLHTKYKSPPMLLLLHASSLHHWPGHLHKTGRPETVENMNKRYESSVCVR